MPARGGRRHLQRLLAAMLDVAPDLLAESNSSRGDPRLRDVPTRALVIVLSALLDGQIESRLATLARRGNPTVVIDTMPSPLRRDRHDRRALAWPVAMLRRDALRARLADHGIAVVTWHGAGSLDHVLTQLARTAAMPRRRQ